MAVKIQPPERKPHTRAVNWARRIGCAILVQTMIRAAIALSAFTLCVVTSRTAAAQGVDAPIAPPGLSLRFGVEGAAFLSRSPGLGLAGALQGEWSHVLVAADVMLAETFSGWDGFLANIQAGAVLRTAENTPYLLAGFGYSTFADVINEKRGRTDWVLTAEAGYLVRRNEGVHEIVIGIRGIVPVASQVYTDSAPALPVVIVIAKLLW